MNEGNERQLKHSKPASMEAEMMGLLAGELEPEQAAAMKRRLERDRELARRFQKLEESWRGLELPPTSPPPLGSRSRIVAWAEAIERGRRELEWSHAPVWARATAALALAAGIVLGVGVSDFEPVATPASATASVQSESTVEWSMGEPGLAELYAEAIEQADWSDPEENGS